MLHWEANQPSTSAPKAGNHSRDRHASRRMLLTHWKTFRGRQEGGSGGWKTKPYKVERRKELGTFSVEKRRLRGDKRALFKHLKGYPTEEGQDLFSIIPECKARSQRLGLKDILVEYQGHCGTAG